MRLFSYSTMVVFLLGIMSTSLLGQAPDLLSFQGRLTNSLGNAVDSSNVSMTFRLYKQGSPVWTETQSVNVDEGYYQVYLGAVEPLDTVVFDQNIELGITLDGDGSEMTPRTWLTSSPFALGIRGMYGKYSLGAQTDAINLVGGSMANSIPGSVVGGTISGGGAAGGNHTVLADWGTIGGGVSNMIEGYAATIGGGVGNTAEGYAATVSGGETGEATGDHSTIGGGQSNTASGDYANVGGGRANHAASRNAVVGGGMNNTSSGFWSTTAGGYGNTSAGSFATVPGGFENGAVGNYVFAAGYRAKAVHEGSFVWNDRSITEGADSLVSTAPNQFLIRAGGGVGIGTTSPSSPLTVNGVIESSSGGIKFPDGSLQTTAIGVSANWKVTGNAGTSPATNYIGTSDTASLVIKVNGLEAGRIQPAVDPADAPNIVLGHRLNAVASGVMGATISGGGRQDVVDLGNTVAGDYSVVGGGAGNSAMGDYATVGGGDENRAAGDYATVPGGQGNVARGIASFAAGSHAKANHDSSFVWNSGNPSRPPPDSFSTSAPNQFFVRAVGGIGMYARDPFPAEVDTLVPLRSQFLIAANLVRFRSHVVPFTDNRFNLGSDTRRWETVFAANGVINTSDRRLKEDIQPVPFGLEEVLQLEPVAFRWKDHPEEGERLGLIAQDAVKAVPTVVTEPEAQDGHYGIRYSELVPVLIRAIQEQQAEIERMQEVLMRAGLE